MLGNLDKNGMVRNVLGKIYQGAKKLKEKYIYGPNDSRTMKMMSDNGMVEGIMGAKNYGTAYKQIKGRLENNDEVGASGYINEQVNKIKQQKSKRNY